MKTITLFTLLLITSSGAARDCQAKGWFEKATPPPTSQISKQELQAVYDAAAARLEGVQKLVQDNRLGDALTEARSLLDNIRQRTDVNPQAKIMETIKVSGILSDADLRKPFAALSNKQKEALTRAVLAYKQGFYLDLLNLAKRTNLVYDQVLYLQLEEMAFQGKIREILERDKAKIRNDILAVSNVAILVKDSEASDAYMLFDVDVASDDQQYLFNRELFEFALDTPDIAASEEALEWTLVHDRSVRFNAYVDGIRTK